MCIKIQEFIPATPDKNAWDLLEEMTGTYPAPEDWSSEHDYYSS